MIKVYFKNNQLDFIGEVEKIEDAFRLMNKDLKEKNINPPYYRSWMYENIQVVDYGSYVNFYEFHFDKDIMPQSICNE
jgi:hypothetical protein